MKKDERYIGIHNDLFGGMTDTGRIIRDAWALGLLAESETCEGWLAAGIEKLWEQVQQRWADYGYQVGNLPDEIRERYLRIQDAALREARAKGWDAELDDEDE